MAAVLRGVAVAIAQFFNVGLASQDAGNNDFVQWYALDLKTVEKVSADVLQQYRRSWHEVGYAVTQSVYMEVGVAAYVDQLFLAAFRLCPISDGFHALFLCGSELHVVLVGNGVAEMWNAIDAMLCQCAIGVEKARRRAFALP